MTTAATRKRLKLRAVDEEDLKVVSAQLQDALVPIADLAFLKDESAFVMVVNRFDWAHAVAVEEEGGEPVFLRTNCAVHFGGVRGVRYRGLDRSDRRQVLELLAVEPAGTAEGGVLLRFAGGADILLDCPQPECRLQDIDEPWPTRHRPSHAVGPEGFEADAVGEPDALEGEPGGPRARRA